MCSVHQTNTQTHLHPVALYEGYDFKIIALPNLRINDEEGIRKLVMEVFQNMWFYPVSERRRSENEQHLLVTRAQNITDVVVSCKNIGKIDYMWAF